MIIRTESDVIIVLKYKRKSLLVQHTVTHVYHTFYHDERLRLLWVTLKRVLVKLLPISMISQTRYRIRWKLGRNFFDLSFERALNNSENMALKVWYVLFQVVIENEQIPGRYFYCSANKSSI